VSNHLNDSTYIIVSTDSSDSSKLSDWHLQVNDSKEDSVVYAPFTVSVELSQAFEINNTPTLILIDRDGMVVSKHLGPLIEQQEIDSFWDQLD
jgi:thioredoxin-related protein